ncbi:hypothetical protein F4808DRAFT_374923 [Astrocystis sublimbata]|nr:hypothetical protein F4808DRAFT_374923 [Astrocystis sublimbata]
MKMESVTTRGSDENSAAESETVLTKGNDSFENDGLLSEVDPLVHARPKDHNDMPNGCSSTLISRRKTDPILSQQSQLKPQPSSAQDYRPKSSNLEMKPRPSAPLQSVDTRIPFAKGIDNGEMGEIYPTGEKSKVLEMEQGKYHTSHHSKDDPDTTKMIPSTHFSPRGCQLHLQSEAQGDKVKRQTIRLGPSGQYLRIHLNKATHQAEILRTL